jgi:hypothetical protein
MHIKLDLLTWTFHQCDVDLYEYHEGLEETEVVEKEPVGDWQKQILVKKAEAFAERVSRKKRSKGNEEYLIK